MNIIKKAKQRIKENLASDIMDFTENNEVIEGLLCEIRCLKVQVCDRGNSFQKSQEKVKSLRSVIKEASDYLDTNKMTNIMHGSVLHQQFKDALERVI